MIKVGPFFACDTGDLMHFTIITVFISLPGPVSNHELNYFVLTWFGFWRLEEDVESVDPQFFVAGNEGEHIAAEPDAEMLWCLFSLKAALEAVPGIRELMPDV